MSHFNLPLMISVFSCTPTNPSLYLVTECSSVHVKTESFQSGLIRLFGDALILQTLPFDVEVEQQ
jgi:hypothetical protein